MIIIVIIIFGHSELLSSNALKDTGKSGSAIKEQKKVKQKRKTAMEEIMEVSQSVGKLNKY